MPTDHYQTLEVPYHATPEEIRAAYLRLVLAHHPDLNCADPSAADRFKTIQQAYEVLSNGFARANYNRARRSVLDPPLQPTTGHHAATRRPPPQAPPSGWCDDPPRGLATLPRIATLAAAAAVIAALVFQTTGREAIHRATQWLALAATSSPFPGQFPLDMYPAAPVIRLDSADLLPQFEAPSTSLLEPVCDSLAAMLESETPVATNLSLLRPAPAMARLQRREVAWFDPAGENLAKLLAEREQTSAILTLDTAGDLPVDRLVVSASDLASIGAAWEDANRLAFETVRLTLTGPLPEGLQRLLDGSATHRQLSGSRPPIHHQGSVSAIDQWLQSRRVLPGPATRLQTTTLASPRSSLTSVGLGRGRVIDPMAPGLVPRSTTPSQPTGRAGPSGAARYLGPTASATPGSHRQQTVTKLPPGLSSLRAATASQATGRSAPSPLTETGFRRSQRKYENVERRGYAGSIRSGAPLTSLGAALLENHQPDDSEPDPYDPY